jgi:hypothetical protein
MAILPNQSVKSESSYEILPQIFHIDVLQYGILSFLDLTTIIKLFPFDPTLEHEVTDNNTLWMECLEREFGAKAVEAVKNSKPFPLQRSYYLAYKTNKLILEQLDTQSSTGKIVSPEGKDASHDIRSFHLIAALTKVLYDNEGVNHILRKKSIESRIIQFYLKNDQNRQELENSISQITDDKIKSAFLRLINLSANAEEMLEFVPNFPICHLFCS